MGFLQPNGRGCRLFRRAPLKPARREPVIIVHSLVQAIAALTATVKVGRAVVLLSAPGAGSYVGPGWFGALVDAAREAVPDARFSAFLNCGNDVGAALAAIRSEIQGVVFTGRVSPAASPISHYNMASNSRQTCLRPRSIWATISSRPRKFSSSGAPIF